MDLTSWSGGSTSLTWNGAGYLKSASDGSTTVNYAYNGLGQRVGKSGGASASYILSDDGIDSQVLNDGAASFVHGASGLVSENRGGTSKFYHADALGSVKALTNGSGSVTDSQSTDAFGMVVTSSGSTPTPFGFAGNHGYQQDSETGLMRLGHRMYDASTGRFISRDPILDGYNWYAYCENDPANAVDPNGLTKVEVRFNQVGGPFNHAYIVVIDNNGKETYIRGGPAEGPSASTSLGSGGSSGQSSGGSSGGSSNGSGNGSSNSSNGPSPGSSPGGPGKNNGPYGPIVTDYGEYLPGTIDYNLKPVHVIVILDDPNRCPHCLNADFIESAEKIEAAQIPYNPISSNSNATVVYILGESELKVPKKPGVWAPGWGYGLPIK
jgi:RHS repeat-associated protein